MRLNNVQEIYQACVGLNNVQEIYQAVCGVE